MLKVLRPVRCALAVVRRSQRACSGSTYPAHDVVGMPALSPTMEVGTIVNWTKEEGDEVTAGETIAEIETDKATINFDAVDDAFLAKILVPAGSEVPVGTPIMVTVEERESVKKFSSYSVSTDSQISQGSVEEERPIAGVKKNETEATSNPNFKEEREARPPSASNETASPSCQEENDSKSLPSAVPDKISENKSNGEFSMWGSSVRKSALAKAISQEQQAFVREFGSSLHSPI